MEDVKIRRRSEFLGANLQPGVKSIQFCQHSTGVSKGARLVDTAFLSQVVTTYYYQSPRLHRTTKRSAGPEVEVSMRSLQKDPFLSLLTTKL